MKMSGYDENVEALSCRYILYVWDCGKRHNVTHLMTCGDASNGTWADLARPTLSVVNCAEQWEESI